MANANARTTEARDGDGKSERANARGEDDEENASTKPPVDWTKRNYFKEFFFEHVTPLISEGTVRRLEPTDLCHLERLDSVRVRRARDAG